MMSYFYLCKAKKKSSLSGHTCRSVRWCAFCSYPCMNILAAIGRCFIAKKKRKLKILMHVSEATRVETRNWRLFIGLKLVKNSSAELCKHLCQSLDPNCLERVVTYWPRCNGRYVLCSVKFTLMYHWCSASLVYCPTRFDELDKIFLEAYLLGT